MERMKPVFALSSIALIGGVSLTYFQVVAKAWILSLIGLLLATFLWLKSDDDHSITTPAAPATKAKTVSDKLRPE